MLILSSLAYLYLNFEVMAEYGEFKNEGIWQHFLREKNGKSAKCKVCKTVLKTVGGSTKGLHEHLRRVHFKPQMLAPVCGACCAVTK